MIEKQRKNENSPRYVAENKNSLLILNQSKGKMFFVCPHSEMKLCCLVNTINNSSG